MNHYIKKPPEVIVKNADSWVPFQVNLIRISFGKAQESAF